MWRTKGKRKKRRLCATSDSSAPGCFFLPPLFCFSFFLSIFVSPFSFFLQPCAHGHGSLREAAEIERWRCMHALMPAQRRPCQSSAAVSKSTLWKPNRNESRAHMLSHTHPDFRTNDGTRPEREGRERDHKTEQIVLHLGLFVRLSASISLSLLSIPPSSPPREHPSCPRASLPPPSASLRPEVLIDSLLITLSPPHGRGLIHPSDMAKALDLIQHLQCRRIPQPTNYAPSSQRSLPSGSTVSTAAGWTCIVTSRAWLETDRACNRHTWIPEC